MAAIIPRRMTAHVEGSFVVFLIGMRVNKPWRLGAWLPVARAMGGMLRELEAAPDDCGFLGHTPLGLFSMVQYWQSFDALERYARAADMAHRPAWHAFNTRARAAGRDSVGIWHETYLIDQGAHETLYSGMPPHGLGRCGSLMPAEGPRAEARSRLRSPSG